MPKHQKTQSQFALTPHGWKLLERLVVNGVMAAAEDQFVGEKARIRDIADNLARQVEFAETGIWDSKTNRDTANNADHR